MSTPSPTLGQQLLSFIEQDGLTTFGVALLNFLNAEVVAQGDPIKMAAAFIALEGNLIAQGPAFLAGLETQLAQLLAAKLSAKLAALPKP